MPLSSLPTEIILSIAEALEGRRDVNSLARTSRRFHKDLNGYLYKQNMKKDKHSALFWAAKHGRENTVRKMLDNKCNVNAKNDDNESALWHAANCGHEGVVALLLEQDGISINSQDSREGTTPLIEAARNGHETVLQVLLEADGIQVDRKDHKALTPLSHAAIKGKLEVAKLLLMTEGFDVNSEDNNGWTPLAHAIRRGSPEVAILLMGLDRVNLNVRDHMNSTLLLLSAYYSQPDVLEFLLSRNKVGIDLVDDDNFTPLAYAAKRGCMKMVECLLNAGPNPNLQGLEDRTALSWAVQECRLKTVKLLLSKDDVEPDLWDNNGLTPLAHAAKLGCKKIVECLLESGANPNLRDLEGRTALSWAVQECHLEPVKLLLSKDNVEPDLWDNNGLTPLAHAAKWGYDDITECLLNAGVNPDLQDLEDRTPLYWAAYNCCLESVELLLSRVDPDPVNGDGFTPLAYAAMHGYTRIVKCLLDGDANPCLQTTDGKLPIQLAKDAGCLDVVKLLKDHLTSPPGAVYGPMMILCNIWPRKKKTWK